MSEPIRLHPDTVRELAVAIAGELRDGALLTSGRPLTVAEVARKLGRSPDFVRDHRHELGVLPAEGNRPRLLFDGARVGEFTRAPAKVQPAQPKQRSRRRQRGERELLPIRGTAR